MVNLKNAFYGPTVVLDAHDFNQTVRVLQVTKKTMRLVGYRTFFFLFLSCAQKVRWPRTGIAIAAAKNRFKEIETNVSIKPQLKKRGGGVSPNKQNIQCINLCAQIEVISQNSPFPIAK